MKTYYKVEDILDKLNEAVKITDINYIDDDDKTLISSDKLLDMIDDLMYEYHRLQDEKDDLEEELKEKIRKELYGQDMTIAEYKGACRRLGVDIDE